jgi:hypothetical protein
MSSGQGITSGLAAIARRVIISEGWYYTQSVGLLKTFGTKMKRKPWSLRGSFTMMFAESSLWFNAADPAWAAGFSSQIH